METQTITAEERDARRRNEEARTWGMLCHLSVFAAFVVPFGNIFGPLTVWLMKKDSLPGVNEQGKEALNFQISTMIYSIILLVVILAAILGAAAEESSESLFVAVGAGILLVVMAIFELVCVIIATVHASRGETFRYPLSIRFIS